MKSKLLILAILIPMLLSVTTSGVKAQDKLPPQLTYIDAQLDIFVPLLQDYQMDYFKRNGEYYQALGSHSIVPTGADVATDMSKHPTDQLTSLAPLWDATGLPAAIAWSFTINTAKTPDGPGYDLVVQTIIKDITWQCIYSFNPDEKSVLWEIVSTKPEE